MLRCLHEDVMPWYAVNFRDSVSRRTEAGSDLVLLQAILPDSGIRCYTILTEVNQDVHRALLHGLAHVEIVIVIVGKNLLDGTGGACLEGFGFLSFP